VSFNWNLFSKIVKWVLYFKDYIQLGIYLKGSEYTDKVKTEAQLKVLETNCLYGRLV
jgi:hypothetical protein